MTELKELRRGRGLTQKEAAKIAIEEVEKFLPTSKHINKVIFDVFGNDDLDLYNSMLN